MIWADARARVNGFQWYSDDDVVWAGSASIGLNFKPSPTVYVGLEGKYYVTGQADFGPASTDLDGIAAVLSFGVRF